VERGGLAACAAQRLDPDHHGGRALPRHPDRQLGADRDRVQPSGPREAPHQRAQPARLPDAAGNDGDLHADRRSGEPADRSRVRVRGPAGEAEMTTPVATSAPTPLAYFATQTYKAFNTNKTSWIGLAIFVIVILLAI